MTEVERQATTSKLVRSTILTESTRLTTANSTARPQDRSPSRRSVAVSSSSSSNSGVLFLFGGLLTLVAVIAAFALPAMMRNNQPSVIVNNQPPISKPITTESNPPIATAPNNAEAISQILNVEANKESLVVPNKLSGNVVHAYKISAKAGQLLSVAVTGNGVLLTVLNEQGVLLPGAVNVPNADLDITADGTYAVQLRVIAGAAETPYQLKVSLKDKAIAAPPTPLAPPTGIPTPPIGTPMATPSLAPSPAPTPQQTPPPPQIEIKVRNR